MFNLEDTIVALASPPGPAERGIVRVSGTESGELVARYFEAREEHQTSARVPIRTDGLLRLPTLSGPLPAALMRWPTRRSYTGQPLSELHLIGSPPLLDAVIEALCAGGARLARRGEFTMRAFLAGRMDLLQAEAVLGVIEATDHDELQTALAQLGGAITTRLSGLRQDLIALLGDLEAGLDFVDEDIEFVSRPEITRRLQAAGDVLEQLSGDAAHRLPSGRERRVVLAGLPNAGKSTLFNRLAGAQRALVSSAAGTTRDYVSAHVQLEGLSIELIDTAGWDDVPDHIRRRAQELRAEQLRASDLVVWCTAHDLDSEERREDERLRREAERHCSIVLPLTTCIDRPAPDTGSPPTTTIRISAVTGSGLPDLLQKLISRLQSSGVARSELLGTSAVRCRDSLTRAAGCLQSALLAIADNAGDELLAAEIRQALRELAVVLGEVYTDDILDHIFSRFCIGK